MKALIPLILILAGLVAGAGAGWFMRPPATVPHSAEMPEDAAPGTASGAREGAREGGRAVAVAVPEKGDLKTLRLPNQFLVPLVSEDRVRAVIVIGLALELSAGHDLSMSLHEARLRASFLQALFDHANLGGFDGVFTSGEVLLGLRRKLRAIAREELGDAVHDVLITELMRQEA